MNPQTTDIIPNTYVVFHRETLPVEYGLTLIGVAGEVYQYLPGEPLKDDHRSVPLILLQNHATRSTRPKLVCMMAPNNHVL